MNDLGYTPEEVERIVNWVLPGLTMYYRDTELEADVISNYTKGLIFRNQIFVDVSGFAGKPTKSCRFVIASSKAAPLYQVNPATEKWELHTINCESFFKVLDVYKKDNTTQVFLLHIPSSGVALFSRADFLLGEENLEEQMIARARKSFDDKAAGPVYSELEEEEWIKRTRLPIGLAPSNNFYPLERQLPISEGAVPLYKVIREMTDDTSLNLL
ncbi:MAG TPA: hypothetical protein PLD87_11430 [Bacteroidia bacterium]|nr:hypothetical protein [Bacteroidia bacterium]